MGGVVLLGKGGFGMISAWFLIPAVLCGVVVGVFLLGILSACRDDEDDLR